MGAQVVTELRQALGRTSRTPVRGRSKLRQPAPDSCRPRRTLIRGLPGRRTPPRGMSRECQQPQPPLNEDVVTVSGQLTMMAGPRRCRSMRLM